GEAGADLLAHAPALVCESEELDAPIAVVAATLDVAALLQPVGDPGDRRTVAAQHGRDAAHRRRLVERVEGEELRRLQAVLGLDVEHPRTLGAEQLHAEVPSLARGLGLGLLQRLRHVKKCTGYIRIHTMIEFFKDLW